MKLTPRQHTAVTHRGAQLLLAASAGSGKTEVLAQRAVALLGDAARPCDVDQLLVVTFTRAAAAELRVRIGRMLRSAAETCEQAGLRAHLRRQEVLIATAPIGTIDSWCGRLTREHFTEAGIDPAFSVLSAEEARLLRVATRRRLFADVYRRANRVDAAGSPGAEAELAARVAEWLRRHRQANAAFLEEMVEQLNTFREQLVNPNEWLTEQDARLSGDEVGLRSAAETMLAAALRSECVFQQQQLAGAASAASLAAVAAYGDALAEWIARLARPGAVVEVVAAIEKFKFGKLPTELTLAEVALLDEVRTRWFEKRLRKRWPARGVARMLTEAPQAAELMRTLLALEARYEALLAAEKRQRAAYEFSDVQRMALNLLGDVAAGGRRTPTAIALELRQRYRHVLVDEFQDTSPVQVELLRLVTCERGTGGNAFYVGDLKQSIYGFRRAEPSLFAGMIERAGQAAESGRVLYLSDNFRSHAALLDGLNRLFAMLLARELGGTDFAADEHLAAGRGERANDTLDAAPRISVCVLEQEGESSDVEPEADGDGGDRAADEEDDVAIEKIEREAALAARHIRQMIAQGVQIPERDANDGIVLRPLRLGDIVVLLRAAAQNAPRVAAVLRGHGLACVTQGRESIFSEVVVRDVRNVLALLANRRRDLELAAYLRGPLVGLRPAELLRIRNGAADARDFLTCVERYANEGGEAALAGRVRDALAQLDRWLALSREEALPALLRRILRESGLLLFAQGMPGGEQRVALLRGLERMAAACAASGMGGVADFVEYIDALEAEELDPGVEVGAGADAARVMTIHASKGLEFPVVFLLNAGARFNVRTLSRGLHFDESVGLGLRFVEYARHTEVVSAAYAVARQAVWERELAENLRLLYVATTRAREKLVIVGHAPAGRWDAICGRYPDVPAGDVADGAAAAPATRTPPPLITRLTAGNLLEWVLMGVAAGGLHRADASGIARVEVATVPALDVETRAGALPPEDDESAGGSAGWDASDAAWLASAVGQISAFDGIGGAAAARRAVLPSVLSVSALKELGLRDAEGDTAAVLDASVPRLRAPVLGASRQLDGREDDDGRSLGKACHRFLELADLSGLGTDEQVAAQVRSLRDDRRLTEAEAALVPVSDVAWFAQTELGRELARSSAALRRETPFVYALPVGEAGHVIVRGVIDCLFDTGAGLVILDYKTDRITSETQLAERLEKYRVQLGLYAYAAERVFARPVQRATLIFLHARRLENVMPALPDLTALANR